MPDYIIKTERLGLRNWQDSDIEDATKMCADKAVMEFFPDIWSPQQTVDFIKRMQRHFSTYGFCYFAVDILASKKFIGFIGLLNQTFESDFTPCVDIGWRLQQNAWGKGYATEGAKGCLDFALTTLYLPEVYAIAPVLNIRSQRVMQKLGMVEYMHFVHPKMAADSHLKNCVVYQSGL